MKYKLKPIPENTVVHTPTEAEAKELLEILRENGYRWRNGNDSLFNPIHYIAKEGFCIELGKRVSTYLFIQSAKEDNCTILTLAEFKEQFVEEEKLNLVELLKGHEGKTFYSTISGNVKITDFCDGVMKPIGTTSGRYCLDGKYQRGGVGCLFPSRDLYEQYPLDPYTAWMKWVEEETIYHLRLEFQPYDERGKMKCGNMGQLHFDDLKFRITADRDKAIEVIDAFLKQIGQSKSVASLCEEIKSVIEKYSKNDTETKMAWKDPVSHNDGI